MRSIQAISADIARLQGELEDVKSYNHKRDSAVHILENLGWSHTSKSGWKRTTTTTKSPTPSPYVAKRAEVNDIVYRPNTREYFVVRQPALACGIMVASEVSRVYITGCRASSSTTLLEDSEVIVVDRNELVGRNLCAVPFEACKHISPL